MIDGLRMRTRCANNLRVSLFKEIKMVVYYLLFCLNIRSTAYRGGNNTVF